MMGLVVSGRKVARLDHFTDEAEALEAAGLRGQLAIGALAAVILVLILLAEFEITTQPAGLRP